MEHAAIGCFLLITLITAFSIGGALGCDYNKYIECEKYFQKHYILHETFVHIEPKNTENVCNDVEKQRKECLDEKCDRKYLQNLLFRLGPLEYACVEFKNNATVHKLMNTCLRSLTKDVSSVSECAFGVQGHNCGGARKKVQCVWRLVREVCSEELANFQLDLMDKGYSVMYEDCVFNDDDLKETRAEERQGVDDRKMKIVIGSCVCIMSLLILLSSIAYFCVLNKEEKKKIKLEDHYPE